MAAFIGINTFSRVNKMKSLEVKPNTRPHIFPWQGKYKCVIYFPNDLGGRAFWDRAEAIDYDPTAAWRRAVKTWLRVSRHYSDDAVEYYARYCTKNGRKQNG